MDNQIFLTMGLRLHAWSSAIASIRILVMSVLGLYLWLQVILGPGIFFLALTFSNPDQSVSVFSFDKTYTAYLTVSLCNVCLSHDLHYCQESLPYLKS